MHSGLARSASLAGHGAEPHHAERLVRSFGAAFAGLAFVAQTQLNWRIHCVLGTAAVAAALALGFSPIEWAVLALTVGGILALEAVNTAIEATVDALPGPHSEDKRHAKDAAAAAVLMGAFAALGVGAALFGPRILSLRP